ncbi:hypothetical protein K450DRAFT_249996 [Umbelopsis ramanniana AG]|uniref:DUF1014-domain-containing protein n=1 Tax=Umbelopsis ramanniana AG TaxID=1314678 RepID=A0AAD5HD41_UMBRA|nr:uncharacterized protein K450DRAFT_249996 [Umbelopsis ramanniana AG]KAI8577788.1 hypothetical protein K450DRAFT_249996 [Umbelopsis ramanniana AG]
MPKKTGVNTKVAAANERKAANQNQKDKKKNEEAEQREAEDWAGGSKGKSKKDADAEKKAAVAAKKAEKELGKTKPTKPLKGEDKKAAKKASAVHNDSQARRVIPEFSASNLDDAIDLLSLDGPGGGTAGGPKNKEVEKHPERRFKAALAAYTEREMPQLKIDHPGLRKQQMEQLIYKNFQKSPENPFNQANILDYNATQEDVQESKAHRRAALEDRLKN